MSGTGFWFAETPVTKFPDIKTVVGVRRLNLARVCEVLTLVCLKIQVWLSCVAGQAVPDVSNDRTSFTLRFKRSKNSFFLDCTSLKMKVLRTFGHLEVRRTERHKMI
jgi:hypothetical protein